MDMTDSGGKIRQGRGIVICNMYSILRRTHSVIKSWPSSLKVEPDLLHPFLLHAAFGGGSKSRTCRDIP